MTRSELRRHYKIISDFTRQERQMREAVLAHSPQLKAKLARCDEVLASLEIMGQAIANLLPPEPEQAALIEGADAPRRY